MSSGTPAPRILLRRDREYRILGGVCSGLARERISVPAAAAGDRDDALARRELDRPDERHVHPLGPRAFLPDVRRLTVEAAADAARRVVVRLERVGDGHRTLLGPVGHAASEPPATPSRPLRVRQQTLLEDVDRVPLLVDLDAVLVDERRADRQQIRGW